VEQEEAEGQAYQDQAPRDEGIQDSAVLRLPDRAAAEWLAQSYENHGQELRE